MHNIGSTMTESMQAQQGNSETSEEFNEALGEFGAGHESTPAGEYAVQEQTLGEEIYAGEAPYGEYAGEQALQEEAGLQEAVNEEFLANEQAGLSEESGVPEVGGLQEELLPHEQAALHQELALHEAIGSSEQESIGAQEVSDELSDVGLSSQEVNQLAHEFMAIQSESELNHFLGKIFRRVGRLIPRRFTRLLGKGLRVVGGVIRRVTKVALPIAGKLAGGFFGGPLGSMIGSKLGNFASGLLEAAPQLNELADPQRQFEIGRRFVRWAAGAALRVARRIPRIYRNVATIARTTMAAARRYAPEWLRAAGRVVRGIGSAVSGMVRDYPAAAGAYSNGYAVPSVGAPINLGAVPACGRWFRRGRALILMMQ